MTDVGPRYFTCAMCGWRGPSAWTEAEAQAEYEQLFNDPGPTERVCDKCFQQMIALKPPFRHKGSA
jgi:hypothetical protein